MMVSSGRRLGPYEVIAPLGAGGMGEVYRATSALNNPNILTVYDIDTHNDSPYLVAELLEGEELREHLNLGAGK